MKRYSVILVALVPFCCPALTQAQEDIQKMSNEEMAEYFTVKACSADFYVVCTDRAKMRQNYNTPEVRRNAVAINRTLDQRLYQEEIDYAVNCLGLDAREAKHGYMVKECGLFYCSWVYKKPPGYERKC